MTDRIGDALERIAAVLEAQEARALAKIKADRVLHEQSHTRAARLLVDHFNTKRDEPLEAGVFLLAKRPLPGDPMTRRVGDEITYDGAATWRKDPTRRERW